MFLKTKSQFTGFNGFKSNFCCIDFVNPTLLCAARLRKINMLAHKLI